MDNDKRIPKLRRQVRVCTINIMAWQENNPSPDKEKAIELKLLQIKLNDALTNYLLPFFLLLTEGLVKAY